MWVVANAAPVVRSGAGWRSGVITETIIGDIGKVASGEQEGFMGLFPRVCFCPPAGAGLLQSGGAISEAHCTMID
jgi:hypothetical protein